MTGNHISWSAPVESFNLRVAAVIIHDQKVLLCTDDGLGYWFLPGGRIRFGEPLRAQPQIPMGSHQRAEFRTL